MLFESTIKMEEFKTIPIIVIFNKMGLGLSKLPNSAISVTFPDFSGNSNWSAAKFFAGLFSKLDTRLEGTLKIYLTDPVDAKSLEPVLLDISQLLKRKNFGEVPSKRQISVPVVLSDTVVLTTVDLALRSLEVKDDAVLA